MPFRSHTVRHDFNDALSRIDPGAFEHLVGAYYRTQGYEVVVTGSGHGARRFQFDGGIDLEMRRGGELTLVQCKRENVYQVTHNVVNQLFGVMHARGAQHGIVVTTGEYTHAAMRDGAVHGMQLIDGHALRRMLGPMLPTGQTDFPSLKIARRKAPKRVPFPFGKLALGIVTLASASLAWTYYQAVELERSQIVQATAPPVRPLAAPAQLFIPRHGSKVAMARPLAKPDPGVSRLSDAQYREWLRSRTNTDGTIVVTDDTMAYRASTTTPAEYAAIQRRRRQAQTSPVATGVPVTAEERKAWEKQNAESMEILERTTPEWRTY